MSTGKIINRNAIPDALMGIVQSLIAVAGHSIAEDSVDGWVSDHPVEAQSIIDGFAASVGPQTVAAILSDKKRAIETRAAQARADFIAAHQPNSSLAEQIGWTEKARQARAWLETLDDNAAPLVVGESAISGETTEIVANRIIRNAAAMEAAEGAIAGRTRQLKNAASAIATGASTLADLQAIVVMDIETGWPAAL